MIPMNVIIESGASSLVAVVSNGILVLSHLNRRWLRLPLSAATNSNQKHGRGIIRAAAGTDHSRALYDDMAISRLGTHNVSSSSDSSTGGDRHATGYDATIGRTLDNLPSSGHLTGLRRRWSFIGFQAVV